MQSRRGIRVTEERARVCEQGHAEEPLGVDVLVAEVVRHQLVEHGARVVPAAELAVSVRERAAEAKERRVLVHGPPDRVLELREPALCAEGRTARTSR